MRTENLTVDALLGELSQMPNVLALAFHVDYWDSIGNGRDVDEALAVTFRPPPSLGTMKE